VSGGAGGAAWAQWPDPLSVDGRSDSDSAALQNLSPVQVYAAPQAEIDSPEPLPEPLPPIEEGPVDPPGTGNSLLPSPENMLSVDASYIRGWSGLRPGSGRPGLHDASNAQVTLSFAAAGKSEGWTLGARNWSYSRTDGTRLVLGNEAVQKSLWGDMPNLAGIGVSQTPAGGWRNDDQWSYSLAVGALDQSAHPGESGDLTYGPKAGEGVVTYGLNRHLKLESQLQWASDMAVTGLGGRYDVPGWGAWRLGVSRAARDLEAGWRYRVGYEADVLESLNLGWTHDAHTSGYSDLADYQAGPLESGRNRNLWSATLSLGRWGNLEGSFEKVTSSAGVLKRKFGLSQQFWYSPNLRISLKADRELVGDSYDIGLNFAIPLF